ncbi:MAG: HemK family protein methyltransferase, partial [Patescibacteria group bacterium]
MEVFLSHLLGWERVRLLANSEQELPVRHLAALQSGWLKIREGFPVAYLTHEKEFFGHSFYVDERVLVPRGETELLVEMVLEKADELSARGVQPVKILEIGTGSGAIALSLKKTNPELEIAATAISPEALDVANKNCVHLGAELR